jgi:hypothetical protein
MGYGSALQVLRLEGFDSLGLHQVYAGMVFNGLARKSSKLNVRVRISLPAPVLG